MCSWEGHGAEKEEILRQDIQRLTAELASVHEEYKECRDDHLAQNGEIERLTAELTEVRKGAELAMRLAEAVYHWDRCQQPLGWHSARRSMDGALDAYRAWKERQGVCHLFIARRARQP